MSKSKKVLGTAKKLRKLMTPNMKKVKPFHSETESIWLIYVDGSFHPSWEAGKELPKGLFAELKEILEDRHDAYPVRDGHVILLKAEMVAKWTPDDIKLANIRTRILLCEYCDTTLRVKLGPDEVVDCPECKKAVGALSIFSREDDGTTPEEEVDYTIYIPRNEKGQPIKDDTATESA